MTSVHLFPSSSASAKALRVFMFSSIFIQVYSLQFNYNNFSEGDLPDFKRPGDSNIYRGALQITTDTSNPTILTENSKGRILYKNMFKLWRDNGSVVASFNTSFVLNIVPIDGTGGEGLAFILTKDAELPNNSDGQWLGITNETTNGSSKIVAIEFDTRKSYAEDVDDNHMGVDINGMISLTQVSLSSYGVKLSNVSDVLVNIQYDGKSRNMSIDVSMVNNSASKASIRLPINLSEYLPEDVYVGFSGSTGNLTQLNCIKSWNFSGEDIERKNNLLLWILIGTSLSILFSAGLAFYLWRRKRSMDLRKYPSSHDIDLILQDSAKGPSKFQLKELKSATENFDPKNKLGQGGFGEVYKGVLKKTNEEVAVKRVSKDSRQGEQEFVAEVMTISQLKHKNLVKLIGWCHERKNLLLVYEFMPNGSLDKLIFSNRKSMDEEVNSMDEEEAALSWERRHNIICGVASALCYLHMGCKKMVLHRDVKSSNVMLDSNYNARLGDFGLARTIQQDGNTHHSTKVIAGTPGYMAPEYFLTGWASAETDVYAFGVFTMEVASGKKPQDINMVDWLWNLYGRQRILDAADPQLYEKFDKEQMECVLKLGLACCHPNPNERPSMMVAFQVLIGEGPPPTIPTGKPAFMWPVMPVSLEDLSIDLDDG
ncbi:putative L-type lectin-domain containing receptor kinase S.5 [Tasmannia lanceolata]|uniref:putative L-type lectin-domain containing receptor kinase S.5 n=1 Tax=Tasmannia lanceolata TaxID=3420 RepID=UPI004064688A